jgi:hypothetical protein
MTVKAVKLPNLKLVQGESYSFTIHKSITLGQNEEYYVMREPFGYKLLMPKTYYVRYGFDIGQQVICRIDKINCIGRVFLEPRHPYYCEGEIYNFDVVRIEKTSEISQNNIYNVVVRDVLGYEWLVVSINEYLVDKQQVSINCLVQRIKKGRLYLMLTSPD